MLDALARLSSGRTGRASSWNTSGRNKDCWVIEPGETRVLADISGPGRITHIWMTQPNHYRECLLRITWDDAPAPSVLCPLGDFFGLGHGLVASYQSILFTSSTRFEYQFEKGAALNAYAPMPFRKRARVELLNESREPHRQYFYIDYEQFDAPEPEAAYFHAEWRRENPFGGWGPETPANAAGSHIVNDVPNKERDAWRNNYVLLETRGRGHYIGCNLSVTNFRGDWWGEGDDMIWVDGYKWPPDLHGTGSEDYLNQAWGMQENAFLRNGSSIYEGRTIPHRPDQRLAPWGVGGYQTSYVFHLENPVRFRREIKVTIEHGHANHLGNEMSSTAYWYAAEPAPAAPVPPVAKRMPVLRDNQGRWLFDPANQTTTRRVTPNADMRRARAEYARFIAPKPAVSNLRRRKTR